MYRTLIPLLIGLTAPAIWPALPPLWLLVVLGVACIAFWAVSISARRIGVVTGPLAAGLLGVIWACLSHQALLANQLDGTLQGQDLALKGRIDEPVEQRERRVRFTLESPTASMPLPDRIQLSWYSPPDWVRQLRRGDRLAVTARLKRPRGFVNPGGFDYQLWQLRRGVGAVGYVREASGNRLLASDKPGGPRTHLRQWLKRRAPDNEALLVALLLGERQGLDDHWPVLRQTGTAHLLAISGLHVGLAAGLGYALGLLLGRFAVLRWPGLRAQTLAAILAALTALAYSALAGFALPTQRALAMLWIFYALRLAGWRIGGLNVLLMAAVGVCLMDPLAPLGAGFWLSFGAVGALVVAFDGWRHGGPGRWWRSVVYPQWVVFLALLVPLALWFGEVSLVAPVANTPAIGWVSVAVVPPLLLGALMSFVSDPLAAGLLWCADRTLDVLWWWLQWLAERPDEWHTPIAGALSLSPPAAALLGLAVLGLMVPGALRLRVPAALLVALALALPSRPAHPLRLTVMDVGQGLAVVLEAKGRTLVYDTGPWFSPSFNAGEDIIVPYLKERGIDQVDALVVSHAHSDHAGGAQSLVKAMPVNRIYLGERLKYFPDKARQRAQSCHERRQWEWGPVAFEFVPLAGQAAASGNDASCVLMVRYGSRRLLLTGDIERSREKALTEWWGDRGSASVLLAPHHGSLTSSSPALVQALSPQAVIFSTGFGNRHDHPRPAVLKRYRRAGSRIYNTATDGAITVRFEPDGQFIEARRESARRFWYDR